MKRQLVLMRIESNYMLKSKDDEEKYIKIENNIISGQDIYEIFYKNTKEKSETTIELKCDNTETQTDKIICQQLNNLFQNSLLFVMFLIHMLQKVFPEDLQQW